MIRELGPQEILFIAVAARWTVALTLAAIAGGSLLGLAVMLMRVSRVPPLVWLAVAWIQAIQGTPLLGQLFVFYFGFGIFGIEVSPWLAAAVAFSIYASAFFAEIWRGCVQAIAKTQWEAAASLGLGFAEQLRHVIVPQAVRIAIPPTVGFWVHLVKNTSLASVIGFVELTRAGEIVNAATFRPLAVFLIVAAFYFAICFTLSRLAARLEGRLHVAR